MSNANEKWGRIGSRAQREEGESTESLPKREDTTYSSGPAQVGLATERPRCRARNLGADYHDSALRARLVAPLLLVAQYLPPPAAQATRSYARATRYIEIPQSHLTSNVAGLKPVTSPETAQ